MGNILGSKLQDLSPYLPNFVGTINCTSKQIEWLGPLKKGESNVKKI